MQTIGLEAVGMELDELMRSMGIEGEGIQGRRIIGNPDVGRPRAFPFGLPVSASTVTATSVTMSTNADRDCFLDTLLLVAASGDPADQASSYLTALTVGGRNATIGAGGFTPLSAFSHDSLKHHKFGVVKSGNPVVIQIANASGNTLLYGASFVALTID